MIWDKLEKNGYCSDDDLCKIYGREPNFSVASEYMRQWRKYKADIDFFKNKLIKNARKGHRCYLVEVEGLKDGQFYRCGKEYYKLITTMKKGDAIIIKNGIGYKEPKKYI